MNISIAIADSDKEYGRRLSETLQQYKDLTIHIYTNLDKFQRALREEHFDIVLFDPGFSDQKMEFPGVKLPLCLYSDGATGVGLYPETAKILKYQRISRLYKEMIREFADKVGYSANFDQSGNGVVLAVYSPIGGSGKTTVALAIAARLSSLGKKVLFFSLEALDSSFSLNVEEENGIISLVEASENENTNFELKLKGIVKNGWNGMQYVDGFHRFSDYDAVTDAEIRRVLELIRHCGLYEAVVIDLGSSLDKISKATLEYCDWIYIVEKPGALEQTKMKLFWQQAFVNVNCKKMARIYNFADHSAVYSETPGIPQSGRIRDYEKSSLTEILNSICKNNEISLDLFLKEQ